MTTTMQRPDGCTCAWVTRGDQEERTGRDAQCPTHGRPWPISKCSHETCRAQIIWTYSETGKPTPIDAAPSPFGLVDLSWGRVRGDDAVLSRVVKKPRRVGRGDLRRNHFATCPAAEEFRQERARRREGVAR